MTKVITIQQCITEIDPNKTYRVPVLIGAPEALVSRRQLCGRYTKKTDKGYQTNPEIKIWSFYFLLKALTTSPFIKNWRDQADMLCAWTQVNEKTFYRYLDKLKEKKLATVDRNYKIHLVGWQTAAHILDIVYCGTYTIEFNPHKYEGKQVFQYLLRGEEIEQKKKDQLEGLMNGLEKNLPLKTDIMMQLAQQGANLHRLQHDRVYFQQRLLQLQQQLFKSGSDVLAYSFTHRADINRSVIRIQEDHCYKSPSSVAYMKRRMVKLGVIEVTKVKVISKARSRFYLPAGAGNERELARLEKRLNAGGLTKEQYDHLVERIEKRRREGYKWFKDQKQTTLILCDQIIAKYETAKKGKQEALKKAAA